MRRSFVAIACAALLSVTAIPAAAAEKADPRQRAMDAAVAAGIPGMVAVADDFRGVSGVANIDRPGKPNAAGRWRVASVSKVFVATLVLQLVAENRVGLDEPVQRYLPGLLPYPEPVTVRQLLQHTSGLPRDLHPEDTWTTWPEVDTERFEHFGSEDQIRLSTSKQPLQFKPGTSWAYSNTGYNVLGLLVEKTTRKPLERVLAERVTRPLHLLDTSLPRDFPFLLRPAAHGYEQLYDAPRGLTDVTTYNYSRYFGAGGIVSSGKDLNRFFEALFGGRLLPADLMTQMKKTVPVGGGMEYGLGLMKLNLKTAGACAEDISIWGHGGDLPGFHTLSFHDDSGKNISTLATVDLTASPDAALKRQLPMISEFCAPVVSARAAAQAPVPSL
ncbi:serine hydrolase domain-containing protein [Amycolatopsis regifaucium]|uniref:Serine hydrolase n=1 Tax=Amycolatopsis regifaucium TaxID=546365 RepID=A0A154MCE4_9PSEU|nr:serine hydrolase domain-containing protein [Amycolatopsis regifaucium]KZB82222.1 serine hydrolase [Amycolatopsis regifaucium]OKA05709.1 serine hydrolase [Amycolatopsis regifaucium]SFG86585.1 D-alanyl-D-alanine carboxypeptidase [Amycolatopsis regifaucium]